MKKLLENWNNFLNEENHSDPSDYLSFMRGDCSLLAGAISEMANLPMYGIFDEDNIMQHVFTYDKETDEAVDCRGRMPVADVMKNIRGKNKTYREVSHEEIQKTFGTYGDKEWEYAEEVAAEII